MPLQTMGTRHQKRTGEYWEYCKESDARQPKGKNARDKYETVLLFPRVGLSRSRGRLHGRYIVLQTAEKEDVRLGG